MESRACHVCVHVQERLCLLQLQYPDIRLHVVMAMHVVKCCDYTARTGKVQSGNSMCVGVCACFLF